MGLIRLLALALVLAGCGSNDAAARLDRALDRMEALAGFHVEVVASAVATAADGAAPLATDLRVSGDYTAPDRARLQVVRSGETLRVVLIGRRTWLDDGGGYRQSIAIPVGPLRDARAPLTFVRGPGAPRFAGLGFSGGSLTVRILLELSAGDLASRRLPEEAVPPDATGVIEVEVGLLDDLIRRQRVEVTEPTEALGTGLTGVRTAYTVEYSRFGEAADIREPD